MSLRIFLWLWIHFDADASARAFLRNFGLAAMILIPLWFANVFLAKSGFSPSQHKSVGLNIQVAQPAETFPNVESEETE